MSRRTHVQAARVALGLATTLALMSAGVAGAATPDPEFGSSHLRADSSVDRLPAPGGEAAGGEDTDGDALLDVWEIDGYDADGDGDDRRRPAGDGRRPAAQGRLRRDGLHGGGADLPLPRAARRGPRAHRQGLREVTAARTIPTASGASRIHLDAGELRGAAYDLGGGNLVPHDADLNPVRERGQPDQSGELRPGPGARSSTT